MFVLEEATLVLLRNMFKSRGSRCNFSFSFSFSFFNDLCIKGSGRWIESEGEEMDELDFSMASVTPQSRGKNECSSFEGGVLCEKYLKEFVKEVKNCD